MFSKVLRAADRARLIAIIRKNCLALVRIVRRVGGVA